MNGTPDKFLIAAGDMKTVLVIEGMRVRRVLQAPDSHSTGEQWSSILRLPSIARESVDGVVDAMQERGWFERVAFSDEKVALLIRALRFLLDRQFGVQSLVSGDSSTMSAASDGDPVSPS